jgi:hypothetical protein
VHRSNKGPLMSEMVNCGHRKPSARGLVHCNMMPSQRLTSQAVRTPIWAKSLCH